MGESGFIGALRLLGFALGVAAAFAGLPDAFAATWPWVQRAVLHGYGGAVLEWAPLFWSCVLALLIFSVSRAALYLVVSLGGLLLALRLLPRRWRE